MDPKDSFFHRQRVPLYLLIIAFGLIVLGAMTTGSGPGSPLLLTAFAWAFPAGLIQSISTQIPVHLALLPGYAVYIGLFIALFRARTVALAQAILIALLIVVIATVSGCHKVLDGFN